MKKLLFSLAAALAAGPSAFALANITGTVYNDVDGQPNGINNLSAFTGSGLQVLLINGSGNIAQIAAVSGGAYTLTSVAAGTYTLRLSTSGMVSAAAPAANFPSGYTPTGEGTAAAGDGTPDGNFAVTVAAANITGVNFGIERTPETAVSVLGFQTNPGGTASYTIPAGSFALSTVPATNPNTADYDGGTVSSIRITAFPASAASITVNGANYTAATFPPAGITVPVNAATNQPTQTIAVDPVDGNLTSVITFTAIDNAGKEDPTPGTVLVPFRGASTISGRVFNDANNSLAYDAGEGLNNVTVWLFNRNAGAPNYLVFPVDSVKTNAAGTYTFSNVATGDYQVRIRFSTVPTATPLPRTVADNNPYTADALANGLTNLLMTSAITSYTNVDFGLAGNVAAPTFTSAQRFSFNAANTFNAGQNNQLTGTYNLAPKTFGSATYTPVITWKQDRNIQPPGYTNQYPQAAYSAGEFGPFFPGTSKGGLHAGDTTYIVTAGDFGDYDVHPANNNRTTTTIKFSHAVVDTKFSVYDVDNADPLRLGGRIDHVKVTGYRNGTAVIPVITNPSATPWNTISGNTITGWPDYDVSNPSFSFNSGNADNTSNNVYIAAAIDSIAVEYEEWAPVLIGPKGVYDGQQNSEAAWVARTPEGRGIAIGSIDYKNLSLSGSVYNDANGLTNGLIDGTGTNVGGTLYANLVNSSGVVVATTQVAADGTYLFNVDPGTYTVKLTTSATAAGAALPAGWANTGDGIIATGNPATGDGAPDGSVAVTVADADITGVNFGIDRIPVADVKAYNVAKTAFTTAPPAGYPMVTNYVTIPTSSAALTGYAAGGSLTGSDAEDCTAAGTCNTGKSFKIGAINANTLLYYDFGAGNGGVQPVMAGTTIPNYNPSKLVIYGMVGSGTTGSSIGFTYALTDAAGITGAPVAYSITSSSPLHVVLEYFSGRCNDGQVQLSWKSAVESGIGSYSIERSGDGEQWLKVATVAAFGSPNDYQCKIDGSDQSLYRLSITGISGVTSTMASVRVACGEVVRAEAVTLYPNPNTGVFNIGFVANESRGIHIRIINTEGRAVYSAEATAEKGSNTFPCSLPHLAEGAYYVVITDDAGIRRTIGFRKGE